MPFFLVRAWTHSQIDLCTFTQATKEQLQSFSTSMLRALYKVPLSRIGQYIIACSHFLPIRNMFTANVSCNRPKGLRSPISKLLVREATCCTLNLINQCFWLETNFYTPRIGDHKYGPPGCGQKKQTTFGGYPDSITHCAQPEMERSEIG